MTQPTRYTLLLAAATLSLAALAGCDRKTDTPSPTTSTDNIPSTAPGGTTSPAPGASSTMPAPSMASDPVPATPPASAASQ